MDCHSDLASFKIVALTISIVILTIAIEVNVHKGKDSITPPTESSSTHISYRLFPRVNRNPTHDRRASRFARATLLIVPICVVFAYRILFAQKNNYAGYNCAFVQPHWTVISIFNILPMTCACFAWLRSLADCILARFDKTVSYKYWPPAFPIFVPIYLLDFATILGRDGAMLLMKQRAPSRSAERTSGDIEMGRGVGGGEDQGLMQSVDGLADGEDVDDDVTVFSPRTSLGSKSNF